MQDKAIYVGGSNYITHIEHADKKVHEEQISQLKAAGFEIYAQHETGIDDSVFCTTLHKETRIANVTYYARMKEVTVSVYEGPVPERLHPQEYEKVYEHTQMHMMELFRLGNSFVFQLQNGHFVISDGGLAADLPYLLDYLETLVAEGEKPVIDGWVITHAHGDHCGCLCEFTKHPEWLERVCVEGIYYSEPSETEVLAFCGCEILDYEMKWVAHRCKCNMYRPQTGQRYYFGELTMDILYAQELVPFGRFRTDLNTSSTVCMFTIDGQKLLFSGDIQEEGLEWLRNNYSKEYLDVDFFTLNHHGLNLDKEFAEYANAQTMLLTVRNDVPFRRIRETKSMVARAKESVVWGDGTKVFTFPYKPGTYKTLPEREWIYHEGQERPPQRNLYTCPGKLLKGWIFDARILRRGTSRFFQYLKEQGAMISVFSLESQETVSGQLKILGAEKYVDLLLTEEKINQEDPYLDVALQVEKAFGFDHVYKYVVVTDDLDVVKSVMKDGFKTMVPTEGKELEPELQMRCWRTFETLETIYELLEMKKIYFKEKYEGDLG